MSNACEFAERDYVYSEKHNPELFKNSEELKIFHEEYVEENKFLKKPVLNFAQTARAHIERLQCSRADFVEKTLLSEGMYKRLLRKTVIRPTFQTVMQFCVGLSLGGILSEQLLELAGYKLNAQQLAYKKILHSYCGHSIYECDEILVALGNPSIIPGQYKVGE